MSQVSDVNWAALISGLNLRTEGNDIFAALLSLFSGSGDPSLTEAFMLNALTGSPNQLRIRNPSDNAWLTWAEISDSAVTLFSDGAEVPSLGNANVFTNSLTVDRSGSSGIITARSSLSTGIVASLRLGGHNSAAEDTDGVRLDARVTTNTDGSEDFELDLVVMRGGVASVLATFNNTATFAGNLTATTLRQGSTDLDDVIADDLSSARTEIPFDAATSIITQDATGHLYRFTGAASTNRTITLGSQPRGSSWAMFINDSDGAADLTFASAAGPNDVDIDGGTSLVGASGQRPQCVVTWSNGGADVNIRGDNT